MRRAGCGQGTTGAAKTADGRTTRIHSIKTVFKDGSGIGDRGVNPSDLWTQTVHE